MPIYAQEQLNLLSIFLVEHYVGYNCFRRRCLLPKQPHLPCLDIWWCEEARICWKVKEFQKNIYFYFIDYAKAFDCVDHNKLWKILKEMRIPVHLTCLLRNLYAGQEATVKTGHGTADWFLIRKGVCEGCILLICLFNLYVE